MIKRFINRLLGKPATPSRKAAFGKRQEVTPQDHGIDPSLVDERALNVVRTLQQGGYQAYIVGGAVRDLLLGLRPKDFDVATNATPEQVKGLFRRAFIIGRRFRIVHVVFGRGRQDRGLSEVIEVSTFRAYLDSADADQVAGNEKSSKGALAGMKHAVDASGRVLRDNVWGPQEEDAARRDFSINAMYYDPQTQTVVDYHGGIKDAKKRQLRMIGDAATRYREDPVRIIRAVRFAAKLDALGFALEAKTAAPLRAMLPLLADVPQSRLFDEMLKLLQTGHALACVAQLHKLGLQRGIYPLLDVVVERAEQPFVKAALTDTDRRVGEGKPVAPSFLLACVLWADVRTAWEQRLQGRQPPFVALQEAIDEVFDARVGDVSGRGKLAADMRDIWMMQPRFDKRIGSSPFSLVEQPRFRAGFDFLRLRAEVGEVSDVLAAWWEDFSLLDMAGREDLVRQVREESHARGGPGPRRVRGPGKAAAEPPGSSTSAQPVPAALPTPAAGGAEEGAEGGPDNPDNPAAPRKRRRRRKPAGAAPGDAADGRTAPGTEPERYPQRQDDEPPPRWQ